MANREAPEYTDWKKGQYKYGNLKRPVYPQRLLLKQITRHFKTTQSPLFSAYFDAESSNT